MITRRKMLKWATLAGGAILIPIGYTYTSRSKESSASNLPPSPFEFKPFRVDMPVPPVLAPEILKPAPGSAEALVGSDAVFHGIAPEFFPEHPTHCAGWNRFSTGLFEKSYLITMEKAEAEIIKGVKTEIFGYNGLVPGPTLVARFREPIVVRHRNDLDVETSVHLHGAHNPAHADGYPEFYVLPGRARDYYYPNITPRAREGCGEEFEISEVPSTMWYHDHGMDLTGFNVSRGLAGFYLLTDDLEDELIENHVLPEIAGDFDIPIALQDQRFNADGSLFYDFFDHNGRLGDVFTANGVAQPKFRVERRKYRFRILNASNARIYHLRLSSGQPFLVIGTDSWLLPEAHPMESFTLAMAERQDVIIDFSRHASGDEVFLENVMEQTDGRGPDGINENARIPLIQFVVEGNRAFNDLTIEPGTKLREHVPIREEEIVKTRRFEFVRGGGIWQVNNRLFSPRRADAAPVLGTAERWIFENKSGGWWHPVHIHLESHHIQKLNGTTPPFHRRFKVDVSTLTGNGISELFMKFRTFTGPFVFHCHNLEHEDSRMMAVFDPQPDRKSRFDGVSEAPPEISGLSEDFDFHSELRFPEIGDVKPLEGKGVGVPEEDFEPIEEK